MRKEGFFEDQEREKERSSYFLPRKMVTSYFIFIRNPIIIFIGVIIYRGVFKNDFLVRQV